MAATIGVIAAISSIAAAGTGIASSAGAFGGPDKPKIPGIPSMLGGGGGDRTHGDISSAAGRGLGGASPEFFAGLDPGRGMDALGEIRKMIGQG